MTQRIQAPFSGEPFNFRLSQISDVSTTAGSSPLENGMPLIWDAVWRLWRTARTGDALAIPRGTIEGDCLVWSPSLGWIPGRVPAPGNAVGDILSWSGTAWISLPPAGQLPAGSVTGEVLTWDDVGQEWLAQAPADQLPVGTVDGQVLTWDNGHSNWYAATPTPPPSIPYGVSRWILNGNHNVGTGTKTTIVWNGLPSVSTGTAPTYDSLNDVFEFAVVGNYRYIINCQLGAFTGGSGASLTVLADDITNSVNNIDLGTALGTTTGQTPPGVSYQHMTGFLMLNGIRLKLSTVAANTTSATLLASTEIVGDTTGGSQTYITFEYLGT